MSLNESLGIKENFIVHSNAAVHFKLIKNPEDIRNDDLIFKPEYSHQIFGEKEEIYGYKNLTIKLYYSAANLDIFLSVSYEKRLEDAVPPNIEKLLAEKYLYEYKYFITNSTDFEKVLQIEKDFLPYGTMLNSFTITADNINYKSFEIYKCTTETKNFVNYHARMQTFMLWFIDAASYIHTEDANWKFFMIYEKYKSSDNNPQYAFAGYFTVYEYFSYPDKIRPRISQALMLPPFQGMGLCGRLISSMQSHYSTLPEVYDITVEDPSAAFQKVRDYVDCVKCANLPTFKPLSLKKGFSDAMLDEARNKFRIHKRQARRIYEILRLDATNIHNEAEFREYRLDVKKRLNMPYLKQQILLTKLNKLSLLHDKEEQMKRLDNMFGDLLDDYTKVLDRILEYPFNT